MASEQYFEVLEFAEAQWLQAQSLEVQGYFDKLSYQVWRIWYSAANANRTGEARHEHTSLSLRLTKSEFSF